MSGVLKPRVRTQVTGANFPGVIIFLTPRNSFLQTRGKRKSPGVSGHRVVEHRVYLWGAPRAFKGERTHLKRAGYCLKPNRGYGPGVHHTTGGKVAFRNNWSSPAVVEQPQEGFTHPGPIHVDLQTSLDKTNGGRRLHIPRLEEELL